MSLDPFFHDSYIFHRSFNHRPLHVISASGLTLQLSDGRTIIDATGGPAVACLGHNVPEVAEAVSSQIQKIAYLFSGGGYSEDCTEELAAHILRDKPGGLSKAIFLNSGSEATDAVLKLVTQYWHAKGQPQRRNFISRKQSYHGNTLGALCITGHEGRRKLYQDWMSSNVSFVDACYSYRGKYDGESDEAYVQRLKEQLDAEFQRLGPDTVAAFMAETIAGSTLACVPAVDGYFKAVREVCDKYGALLILDEVRVNVPHTLVREPDSCADTGMIGNVRYGKDRHEACLATRRHTRPRHPNDWKITRGRVCAAVRSPRSSKGVRHHRHEFRWHCGRPHFSGTPCFKQS